MNPTVSIIVPVYKAETFLSRCIDSILNQEYRDFELLLVDDGSPDSSGEICDTYARNDSRIRVIHQPNSGVSIARNHAIDQARGTYLQFLDSDDWITSDATKLLVRSAEDFQADLVIADFYRVIGERVSHKGDIDEDEIISREEFAEHMMENPADYYYGVIWNKLYRRELIEKHHLRMNPDISWCEDFMFNLEYIRYATRFYALKTPIYYYVKTKGSLVTQGASISNTIKMKLNVFEYYNNFYKNILDEEEYEKNRLQVYRFFIDAAKDGAVPPAILPGATRLGEERAKVCQAAVAGEGVLMDNYRTRKLLERYLEPVALKHNLSMTEIWVLFYLCHPHNVRTRRELADFIDISRSALSMALKKLTLKGLIKIEDLRSPKQLVISLLPETDTILSDLALVQTDFDQTRFSEFTEEELIQYAQLSGKIKDNIQRRLQ